MSALEKYRATVNGEIDGVPFTNWFKYVRRAETFAMQNPSFELRELDGQLPRRYDGGTGPDIRSRCSMHGTAVCPREGRGLVCNTGWKCIEQDGGKVITRAPDHERDSVRPGGDD